MQALFERYPGPMQQANHLFMFRNGNGPMEGFRASSNGNVTMAGTSPSTTSGVILECEYPWSLNRIRQCKMRMILPSTERGAYHFVPKSGTAIAGIRGFGREEGAVFRKSRSWLRNIHKRSSPRKGRPVRAGAASAGSLPLGRGGYSRMRT